MGARRGALGGLPVAAELALLALSACISSTHALRDARHCTAAERDALVPSTPISRQAVAAVHAIKATADGGYLLESSPAGDEAGPVTLAKLDSQGNVVWSRTTEDFARISSIVSRGRGDYWLAGHSTFVGPHGHAARTAVLTEIDEKGLARWSKRYASEATATDGSGHSSNYDSSLFHQLRPTSEAGVYLAAGFTGARRAAQTAARVMRFGAEGEIHWDRTFAGTDALAIDPARDGRACVAGFVTSDANGQSDFHQWAWMARLDARGVVLWERALEGRHDEVATATLSMSDGGCLFAGYRLPPRKPEELWGKQRRATGPQAWVRRFDAHGALRGEHIYEPSLATRFEALIRAPGGSVLAVGAMAKRSSHEGDVWVVMFDQSGAERWQRRYGGTGDDAGLSADSTADGGCVISGHLGSDLWVLKLDREGRRAWDRFYNGGRSRRAATLVRDLDGGYVAVGSSGDYPASLWAVKLSARGEPLWQQAYGYSGKLDGAHAVWPTPDHGYLVAAETEIPFDETGLSAVWMLKLDADGRKVWEHVDKRTPGRARVLLGLPAGTYLLAVAREGLWRARLESVDLVRRATNELSLLDGLWDLSALAALPGGGWGLAGIEENKGGTAWQLDGQGRPLWRARFGYGIEPLAAQSAAAAGLLVAGSDRRSQVVQAWAAGLGPRGEVRWQRTYGPRDGAVGGSLLRLASGAYALGGAAAEPRLKNHNRTTRWTVWGLDEQGRQLWEWAGTEPKPEPSREWPNREREDRLSYDEARRNSVLALAHAADGGLVMAGSVRRSCPVPDLADTAGYLASDEAGVLKLDAARRVVWEQRFADPADSCALKDPHCP